MLEKPLPPETGWKDVPAPELVKWEKVGETIAGVLVSASTVQIDGKGVLQMKVFSVQFKGTAQPAEPNAHGVTVTDDDIPF